MSWNSLYGRTGFFEYQFALQLGEFQQAINHLRNDARNRGLNLCFAVIKRFGSGGPGFLSFPREGFTCNFQVRASDEARNYLIDLTDRLSDLGAHIYLAKDAVLLHRHVPKLFPKLARWQQVAREADPEGRVSSDLSVRLGLKPWAKK
jgi:decaprenylphospho-beta-D-ribofuranose 2-oxidase